MPTVCYRGQQKAGFNAGRLGFFEWGVPKMVSQEWLDERRNIINSDFIIEGDMFNVPGMVPAGAKETVDEGNDGIPDAGWVKRDISAWLESQGESVKAGATKRSLLKRVEEIMNTDPVGEPEPQTE